VAGEAHRLLGLVLRHAGHLEEHRPGLTRRPSGQVRPCPSPSGLRPASWSWLVREDPDPDLAATLDVAGHGASSGLDLAAVIRAGSVLIRP
jgi:hypothetical protein